MKNRKSGILHSEAGATMVEVLVAFVILLLIMGIFSQAIGLTGRMLRRSEDTLTNQRELAGGYYLENEAVVDMTESSGKNIRFKRTAGRNESFSIRVMTRTYADKNGNGELVEVVRETTQETGD